MEISHPLPTDDGDPSIGSIRYCSACGAAAYEADSYCTCCGIRLAFPPDPGGLRCLRCDMPIRRPMAFHCPRCGATLERPTTMKE